MKKALLFVAASALCSLYSLGQSVSLGPDQTVCYGSGFVFDPVITGGTAPFTFSWRSSGDTLSCDTCQFPSSIITENSTFIVTVVDSNLNSASDTLKITVNIPGTITLAGPDSFCAGSSVVLQTASAGTQYQWYLNGNPLSGDTSNSYRAVSNGTYQLTYVGPGACPDTTNAIVIGVKPSPVAMLSYNTDSLNLCQGDSVTFSTLNQINVNYEWILNGRALYDSTNVYTTNLSGGYQLVVTAPNGCVDSSTVLDVVIRPLPVVGFQVFPTDTFCSGSSPVTLEGGKPSGGFYGGNAVTMDSIFNPSLASAGLNLINYTYLGPNGCSNIAYDNIGVINCTGIEEWSEAAIISLYPNPASDYALISVNQEVIGCVLQIRDVMGKEILNTKIRDEKVRIETSGMACGIYLLTVSVQGRAISKKLVVSR